MPQCLFCQMAQDKVFVQKIYEDSSCFAIHDRYPQSKDHFLIIPKSHYSSLLEVNFETFQEDTGSLGEDKKIGHLFQVATYLARKHSLDSDGFRCVINTGNDAGQTIFHLHLHLLGGEPLRAGFGKF